MKVIVVGAGHNGLIAAILLAQKGLKVTVLEDKDQIGGAVKTEYPFKKAPGLGTSTGAYLLGVMPPELLKKVGAKIELIRRDPHYFLPTTDGRYLLFGSDKNAMRTQFRQFFSEADFAANEAMNAEIASIREDLAPSWLMEPFSVEETAERFIRPSLRKAYVDLVRRPVDDYLARFGFQSELLVAMYAVTDGFSGLTATFGQNGTGMNFLVHNMCRLPNSDGTFMIVKGGMGSVTQELGRIARSLGVEILTSSCVERISASGTKLDSVVLKTGESFHADIVVCNADPFRMRELTGQEALGPQLNAKLNGFKRLGTTMKINFALKALPTFSCLKENKGQHNGTIHLLPTEGPIIEKIKSGFQKAMHGELDDFPTMEWYIHTQADPSLQDGAGHHNAAFFVQWVPYQLKNKRWEDEEDNYAEHLFGIAERYAPGFRDLVVDYEVMTPPKIEAHFGMSYGHIHHVDNTFACDERMPYRTPIAGLYSCSAGCHPAGSVLGAAGHNAAECVIKDFGL